MPWLVAPAALRPLCPSNFSLENAQLLSVLCVSPALTTEHPETLATTGGISAE
jgi:hypothetical protein